MVWPEVIFLNHFRSSESRHGKSPSFPITRSSDAAAIAFRVKPIGLHCDWRLDRRVTLVVDQFEVLVSEV
jgi:hypothetical protein